jgi:hypothetical protein
MVRLVTLTANEWLRKQDLKLAIAEVAKNQGFNTVAIVDCGYGCIEVAIKNADTKQGDMVVEAARNIARHRANKASVTT